MAIYPVSDICRLQTADCRLQTADCRLQTADYRLQTADYRLQTAYSRPQTVDHKTGDLEDHRASLDTNYDSGHVKECNFT